MSKRKPPSQRPNRGTSIRTPEEFLERGTQIIVAGLRQCGDDDAKITLKVKGAIAEAMETDKEFTKNLDTGRGKPELCLSAAGIFRLAFAEFDLDRSDQREQERWFAVVERALKVALADKSDHTRFPKPTTTYP